MLHKILPFLIFIPLALFAQDGDMPAQPQSAIELSKPVKQETLKEETQAKSATPTEEKTGKEKADKKAKRAKKNEVSTLKAGDRQVLGWTEKVMLQPEELLITAKLTSGSDANKMHAEDIHTFRRGGQRYVRFTSIGLDGKDHVLEKKLIETKTIKYTSGRSSSRHIIESGLCLANVYYLIEFGLVDQKNSDHKIQIGRDILAGHFVIDPGKTKTTRPKCSLPKSAAAQKEKKQSAAN